MMDDLANAPSGDEAGRLRPKVKAAASSAREAYESLKDVVAVAVDETRGRAVDKASQVADRAERRYDDLLAWVQLRPAQALGVAAGVGMVLGLLLRGRSTKTIYVRDGR